MELTVKQGQQNYNTSVKSKNATYTDGTTRAQAQKDGRCRPKKITLVIHFGDIDKDNNGILSQEEFHQARLDSAKTGRSKYHVVELELGAFCNEKMIKSGLFVGCCPFMGELIRRNEEQELENYYNDSSTQKADAKRKLNCDF